MKAALSRICRLTSRESVIGHDDERGVRCQTGLFDGADDASFTCVSRCAMVVMAACVRGP